MPRLRRASVSRASSPPNTAAATRSLKVSPSDTPLFRDTSDSASGAAGSAGFGHTDGERTREGNAGAERQRPTGPIERVPAGCLNTDCLVHGVAVSNALLDEHIGLEETDDGVWAIHFHRVLIATFDERDYLITG